MQAEILTAVLHGIEAVPVKVEADVSNGLPQTEIIGLGDTAVKEAAPRIRAAFRASGFSYPAGRTTLNLSPAWLHKKGSHFDFPMAIGILAAAGLVFDRQLAGSAFIGELGLDGNIQAVPGVLPMLLALKKKSVKTVWVPVGNKAEADLIEGVSISPIRSLREAADLLNGRAGDRKTPRPKRMGAPIQAGGGQTFPDFAEIKGQEEAKRAVMIAVAGGHALMITGSPGTGKSMIAERLPHIMPSLSKEEMLELTAIYSAAGFLDQGHPVIIQRPFRSPSASISVPGMLGSGYPPRPGEITLAHKGILFLDEFSEIDRRVLESLRLPMDQKQIGLVKRGEGFLYPADFMLVIASNPCPCGYYGDPRHTCTCTDGELNRFRAKLSGPLNDRIDIHFFITDPGYKNLHGQAMSSQEMRQVILQARNRQEQRYGTKERHNADLTGSQIDRYCQLDPAGDKLAEAAYTRLALNPRTMAKVKKVARTIADIEGKEKIEVSHLSEALMYRERAVRR